MYHVIASDKLSKLNTFKVRKNKVGLTFSVTFQLALTISRLATKHESMMKEMHYANIQHIIYNDETVEYVGDGG